MELVAAPIAIAAALVPGLYAWWTGRSLAGRGDDPALPELLLARQQRISASAVLCGVLALMTWPGALVPMVALLLVGSYPLRRAIFEETWTLPRYVAAQVRAFVGWTGPYVLLGLMPLVVLRAAPYHVATALFLGAALLLWLHWYAEGWRWGTNASPLLRDDLRPRFEAVIARANVALPALFRFGYDGSAMMNAVALPSLRGPAVAFSDRLLERMAPDEVAAIFAHEVAHLEHFDARRLRRMRLAIWALVVLGVAVPLWAIEQSSALRFLLPWVWPLVIVFALAQRAARAQAHETESDRRAVELTRDPEALIRALTALHVAARVPRRWAREFERTASHPSLARRVQAIRAAGSALGIAPADVSLPGAVPAPGVGAAAPDERAMAPVVLQSTDAGRWVILDAERAHWFDGVPDGTTPGLAVLRERASSYRAQRYGELAELRVAADGDLRVLRATDRAGHAWSLPLQPSDTARAQAALDRVDVALGAPAADRRDDIVGRLLGAAAALAALLAAQFGLVLVPAIAALAKPLPALLALTGGMSIGRALVGLGEADATWASLEERAALGAMLLVGGACVWIAFRRRQESVTKPGMAALLVLVGMASVPLLAAILSRGTDWRAGEAGASSLAVALLGAGSALLVMRGRARRTTGAVIAAVAVPVALLGVGSDRLQGRVQAIEWSPAGAVLVARVDLPTGSHSLQLSPSGDRWAVRHFSPESYARTSRRSVSTFLLGDFAGMRRTTEAGEIALVDDERLLALESLPAATELRLEEIATGRLLRVDTLPPMDEPTLWLDRAGGGWTVTGGEPDGTVLLRVDGTVAGREPRVTVLRTEGADIVSSVHPHAVSIVTPRRAGATLSGPLVMLGGALPFRSDVWHVDSSGRRIAGELAGWPRCTQDGIGAEAVCVSTDARRAALWRIDSAGASRVGALPLLIGDGGYAGGRWMAAAPVEGELLVVEPATRRGLRVSLPDGGYVTTVQPLPDGAGVLALRGANTALVRYRIDPPGTATLARP